MKRFDLWKLSLLNVFSAPVRSMLTVLGFAIGVAAILAVLTLGDAGKNQVESELSRLGIDRIRMTPSQGDGFRQGEGAWVSEITGVQSHELAYLPVELGGAMVTVMGCGTNYLSELSLAEGRMPHPLEWTQKGRIALLGERTAQRLKVQPGERIEVAQTVFHVCGLISAGDGVSSINMEEAVVMPLEMVCAFTGGMVHEIQFVRPEKTALVNVEKAARAAFSRSGVSADIFTMQVQMEAASSVIDTFVNVLQWVALVCILVGGIGVMNILLISVRERRREIGVMKSLGTTPVQICLLFLLEALSYAVIGGILGMMLGFGLIHAAGKSIEISAQASGGQCMAVFAAALANGLLFGVLPAFRASMLKCVDALRQE